MTSIVVFTGVNLLGIRTAVWAQIVMVVAFMAVLVVFGVGGLLYSRGANFTPLFPLGIMAVLQTAIPAFYSYSGFSAIVTFGGEIVNPRRNIPLVLVISLPLITAVYTLVTLAMPGVVNWRDLAAGDATLSRVSSVFLPAGVGVFIGVAAVCAIATSINGLLLTKSRDVFSLALDRDLSRRAVEDGAVRRTARRPAGDVRRRHFRGVVEAKLRRSTPAWRCCA